MLSLPSPFTQCCLGRPDESSGLFDNGKRGRIIEGVHGIWP